MVLGAALVEKEAVGSCLGPKGRGLAARGRVHLQRLTLGKGSP